MVFDKMSQFGLVQMAYRGILDSKFQTLVKLHRTVPAGKTTVFLPTPPALSNKNTPRTHTPYYHTEREKLLNVMGWSTTCARNGVDEKPYINIKPTDLGLKA